MQRPHHFQRRCKYGQYGPCRTPHPHLRNGEEARSRQKGTLLVLDPLWAKRASSYFCYKRATCKLPGRGTKRYGGCFEGAFVCSSTCFGRYCPMSMRAYGGSLVPRLHISIQRLQGHLGAASPYDYYVDECGSVFDDLTSSLLRGSVAAKTLGARSGGSSNVSWYGAACSMYPAISSSLCSSDGRGCYSSL